MKLYNRKAVLFMTNDNFLPVSVTHTFIALTCLFFSVKIKVLSGVSGWKLFLRLWFKTHSYSWNSLWISLNHKWKHKWQWGTNDIKLSLHCSWFIGKKDIWIQCHAFSVELMNVNMMKRYWIQLLLIKRF